MSKLKEMRFHKGLTQWDLVLETGISQSKLSLFERGYLEPKPDEKARLARALGVPTREIFPEGGQRQCAAN
jgi:transcriptional regulator with XRE-family HTH domain